MKHVACGALGMCALGGSALGAMYGPSAYLTSLDSPWASTSFAWSYLETFDDGSLNTPGASATNGIVLGPAPLTDSIDPGGSSFYSNGSTSITFVFNAAALGGNLPTHAGIVWTDVGFLLGGGLGGPSAVVFEAFDENGVSLGAIGPDLLGDSAFDGGQDEDRFYGAENAGGISKIVIAMPGSDDWEVDHLQYGYVPGPGAGVILLAGGAVLGMRRRG